MHKFSKKQRGVILIELALAIPVLVTFLFAFYDCIMIFRTKNAMGNITRIGTLWLNSRIPIATEENGNTVYYYTSPDGLDNYNSKTATENKIKDLVGNYGLSCTNLALTWNKNDTNLLFGTVEIKCTVKNLTVSTLLTNSPNELELTMKGMGYYGTCGDGASTTCSSSATPIPTPTPTP